MARELKNRIKTGPKMMAHLHKLATIGATHRDWYASARGTIARHCEVNGWDSGKFVAVMAVLSPRCSVKRNWDNTVAFMRYGMVLQGTMRGLVTSLNHLLETGEIRGPKTSAFARCLLGDESALVLDVWMAKALGVPQAVVTRKDNLAIAYKLCGKIAEQRGWTMAQTQAAIWCGICITSGVRPGTLENAVQATAQVSFDF